MSQPNPPFPPNRTNHPNPYAAPPAVEQHTPYYPHRAPGSGYVGVEHDRLVVGHNATLPNICVKTGMPATRYISRKFSWHTPLAFLGLLVNILVYIVLALILRKQMDVQIPVSEEFFRRRQRNLWVFGLLSVASVVAFVGGIVYAANLPRRPMPVESWTSVTLILGGLLSFFVFIIIHNKALTILRPKKIDDHFGWYKGACPQFLAAVSATPQQAPKPQL